MRNKIFALLLVLNLVLGAGIFILPQKYESQSEKRLLNTNESIKLDAGFSRSVENVLKDQFYFRDRIVRYYYKGRILLNVYTEKLLYIPKRIYQKLFGKGDSMNNGGSIRTSFTYLAEGVVELDDGYLINGILEYNDDEKYSASSRGYNVNEFALKHPEFRTYVYFPTRTEELLNSEYEFHPVCQEWFIQQLDPSIKYSSLQINDMQDFENYYFKSDYHWNAYGAYQGYSDIINMISEDYQIGSPKAIKKVIEYPYNFYGNIANKIDGYGSGDYIIDLELEDISDFDYYVNGEPFDFYAVKETYRDSGNDTVYSDYDLYFGDNFFLREFDFHAEDKPDLLMFADSFSNTNMMWIASHFNKTIIIDLRAKPEDFNLSSFIKDHDIDVALVCYYYNNAYFNGNLYIPID
ncbi:MAG: hypothetical protein IJJ00_06065 [Erysipelotrichaceae bacterium]|nr:hypothetical protein [Erysipelotrichaceae bacterium]